MKKYMIALGSLFIVANIAFFGLKDMALQKILEKKLTESLGTNVKIYGVDYYVFKERLELKGVGIESKEDTSLDSFYFGEINTKLKLKEVFNKKVAIESIGIKDIEINKKTDRINTLPVKEKIKVQPSSKITKDEFQDISASLLKAYEKVFGKIKSDDPVKNQRAKSIFLALVNPFVDKYVDYKLSEVASKYVEDILEKYNSTTANLDLTALQEGEWDIEIKEFKIETKLFNRYFVGDIKNFSTEDGKLNQNLPFNLKGVMEDEVSIVKGNLNLENLTGVVDTSIANAQVKTLVETNNMIDAKVDLVQKLTLTTDKQYIDGNISLKNIDFNKEIVSEKILGDKNGIDKIVGSTKDKIGNIKINYKYNPHFNRVFINSNITKEVLAYIEGDESELEDLKNEIKSKVNEKYKETVDKVFDLFN